MDYNREYVWSIKVYIGVTQGSYRHHITSGLAWGLYWRTLNISGRVIMGHSADLGL